MTEPTASPEVTELIGRLLNRRLPGKWSDTAVPDGLCIEAADALLALRQEAEASLRLATQRREDVVEALKPFAAFGAAVYGPLYGDNEPVFGPVGTEEHTLKVRDFRRAALALQPKEN